MKRNSSQSFAAGIFSLAARPALHVPSAAVDCVGAGSAEAALGEAKQSGVHARQARYLRVAAAARTAGARGWRGLA